MNNLSEINPNAINQFNSEALAAEIARNKEALSKKQYLNFCVEKFSMAIHLRSLPALNLLVDELRDELSEYQKDRLYFDAASSDRIDAFLCIMMSDFYHPHYKVIIGEDYNTTYTVPGFETKVEMMVTDDKEFNFWLSTMFPQKETHSTLLLHQQLHYPRLKEQLFAAITRHDTTTLLLIFATWLHHYTHYSQIDNNMGITPAEITARIVSLFSAETTSRFAKLRFLQLLHIAVNHITDMHVENPGLIRGMLKSVFSGIQQNPVSHKALATQRLTAILHQCIQRLTLLEKIYISINEPQLPQLVMHTHPQLLASSVRITDLVFNHGQIDDLTLTGIIIPMLNQLVSLKRLDLSHNYVAKAGLQLLLAELTLAKLKTIDLSDNQIQCCDEIDWQGSFELWERTAREQRLPRIKRIDLSGNAIVNNNKGIVIDMINKNSCEVELYKLALDALLGRANLTLTDFIDASWRGMTSDDDTGRYRIELKLDQNSHVTITLDDVTDYYNLVQARDASKVSLMSDFFNYMKIGIKECYSDPNTDWEGGTIYQQLSSVEQQSFLDDVIANHHPGAPLALLLHRHVTYCTKITGHAFESLLFQQPLNQDKAYVYLIAYKKKNFKDTFSEHAALFLEYITPEGQRVLNGAELLKSGLGFTVVHCNFGRTKRKAAEKILRLYDVAQFDASLSQCQSLWSDVNKEIGVPTSENVYSLLGIRNSFTLAGDHQQVQNCVTWALDKIDFHLDIKTPRSSFANIPSQVVSYLLQKPKHRPPAKWPAHNHSSLVVTDSPIDHKADKHASCSAVNTGEALCAARGIADKFFKNNKSLEPKQWRKHSQHPQTYYMLFKKCNKKYADRLQVKLQYNLIDAETVLTQATGDTNLKVRFY